MQLECGPETDRRVLTVSLAEYQKIGVFVSGGVDSALLYYLLQLENIQTGSSRLIRPIVIHRREGSKYYSYPVIEHINRMLNIDARPVRLGNTALPEPEQVKTAVLQAFRLPPHFEAVYVGVIVNRPEHMIGFDQIKIEDHERVFMPLKNLEKCHIIDLYYTLGIQDILNITFSCDQSETVECGTCNGCRERQWGFDQVNRPDPKHDKSNISQ